MSSFVNLNIFLPEIKFCVEKLHASVLEYKKTFISLYYSAITCTQDVNFQNTNIKIMTYNMVNNAVDRYGNFTGVGTSNLGLTYRSGSLISFHLAVCLTTVPKPLPKRAPI
jgi:hypothetical protein